MYLSDMHDHMLVFAKDATKVTVNRIERTAEQLKAYQNPDNDPRGPWRAQDLSASKTYKAGVFTITGPTGEKFDPPPRRYWRCNREQYEKWLADNRITFGKAGNSRPMRKSFLSEASDGVTPNTWWDHKFAGHNKEAKLELKKIFGGEAPFDTPKPVKLLERIIDTFCDDDGYVLDSFAGSGTSAHAVLSRNKNNNSSRKFIIVQQQSDTKDEEKQKVNITKKVTRQRIAKAISGTKSLPGLGGSFTYAKLSDEPLFGDYRDLGDALPAYDEIASYVFYTETSTQWAGADKRKNKAFDKKTGRIGEHGPDSARRSYYLLYDPNDKLDAGIDKAFLDKIAAKDPNHELVVYAEKVWVHRDQLRAWERANHKRIRPMLVPFNLK